MLFFLSPLPCPGRTQKKKKNFSLVRVGYLFWACPCNIGKYYVSIQTMNQFFCFSVMLRLIDLNLLTEHCCKQNLNLLVSLFFFFFSPF